MSSYTVNSLHGATPYATDIESQHIQKPGHQHQPDVLEWENVSFVIKGRTILNSISGRVESGEMLAVMGPSGAGKSTVLDILSKRTAPTEGIVAVNGDANPDMSELASYVEQADALLGVLSVEETIRFAARLSLDPSTPKEVIQDRVVRVVNELGLTDVRNNRIGNAVQRGISGGQKRRVTIGSSLVTQPRILLLDEPTSGLDSRTSREVLAAIKNVAQQHGMIVVATIHQPNWETFALFDKLLLMAQGNTVFFGPISRLATFLSDGIGHPVPEHANPTDHALDVVSTDFMSEPHQREAHISEITRLWTAYSEKHADTFPRWCIRTEGPIVKKKSKASLRSGKEQSFGRRLRRDLVRTGILMERNAINYSRNLLAYGVRIAMYIGMGVLLATVWVNLAQNSSRVNDRLSVHFFSVAFLGFMSVAGIPAFLEERLVFTRERMNGLYGPGAYVFANTIVTLPYLFLCVVLFAVICYWSIGLNPGTAHFFKFLGILFLAVFTAEAQSTIVAAILPIFVAALAIASFLNGFWMCVGGYLIKAVNLPRFWYDWAHFIDFQTYAFDLLVFSDFHGITLNCEQPGGTCDCGMPSTLGECELAGDDVLTSLDILGIDYKLYAVILLIIALIYRVLLYVVLVVKKR